MFSLISRNNLSGATTIKQASQGHRFPTNRCNNCTCSPGLLSRNQHRSSVYLKRMMSSSHVSRSRRRSSSAVSSPPGSPGKCTTKEVNTTLRLESVRTLMKEKDLGVYIIPSEDAHQSEYTSPVDGRREFISGFTGSAGVAVLTRELGSLNEEQEGLACLATDGRYFTQAANELDFNWNLLKLNTPNTPTWEQWAVDQAAMLSLDSGELVNIGVDPKLLTYNHSQEIQKLIDAKIEKNPNFKIKLVPVRDNLIDLIWSKFEDLPVREFKPIIKLGDEYTGETTRSKLDRLDELYFKKYDSNTLIVNALDEIAWLLNIRGDDIEYNPLFYSYLIIEGKDKLTLYTDNHERFDSIKDYLEEINCSLKKYEDVWTDIRKLATALNSEQKKLLLTNESTWKIVNCIIAKNFMEVASPIKELKEIKNEVELQGQKKAQIDDGFALIKYFAWLEQQLISDCEFISEYEAAMKLLEIRSTLPNFKGLSFETISSTGANAAIIHYSPPVEGSAIINPEKIYLCDSGSQFLNGTTDTTRTIHFSTPSEEEVKNYTLVLKGHIALARLVIPNDKVTGFQIDCIARQFLWSQGLDYGHGTGHGVDSYGPVHSAGVGIGFRAYCNENTIKKGHLVSDEPGYYKPGEYGIRIENMVFSKEKEGVDGFLEFETTTMVPYCRKLINVGMLSEDEKKWVNEYHSNIYSLYADKFEKKSWEYQWLKRETTAL